MKRFVTAALQIPLSLALMFGTLSWPAQAAPEATGAVAEIKPGMTAAATAATALDPAIKNMLLALGSAMLANFAASASSGSLDKFDPAPMLESALKSALNSRELNRALDRLVDQSVSAGDAAGASNPALSPEMRALVKAALQGAVTMARAEIAREFAPAPATPTPTPGAASGGFGSGSFTAP